MFLILEEDTELLSESPGAARERARERDYQGPEADASTEMDRIFSSFAPTSDQIVEYPIAKLEASPLNETIMPNLLRAIGGATYRALQSEGRLLLDGLAVNCLRKVLEQHGCTELSAKNLHSLVFESAAKKYSRIPVDELIRYINTPGYWDLLPLKGRKKGFEFSLRIRGGRRQKLVFVASFDGEDPWPTDGPQELIEIRIGGKISAPDTLGQLLGLELDRILMDQKARRRLAERFAAAPRVRGIKGSIRESIGRELEGIGIPQESYSREGFSSGRFPYSTTRTPVEGKKLDLIFGRCEHCGVVKELTVEPQDERMRYTDDRYELHRAENVCAELTRKELAPWHESFCLGKSLEPVSRPVYAVEDL